MPHLVKGSYLLAVETPVESMPVEIQPVVVGIDLPDTGPPADVVHQYLKMAGLELEGRSDQEQQ